MENNLIDFRKFAKSNGVSMSVFDDYTNKKCNSLTPMIMEESPKNFGVFDIYSKMLCDRIIFFGHEFNPDTCNVVSAELLYLNSTNPEKDINIYINSPGGDVISGLGVIDTMNFLDCDVSTTCMGMAASMGAVLLSCGAKGKRCVLTHSRVMIHQVSSSFRQSTYSDLAIELEETRRCREDLYKILAENTNKTFEEIEKACDRNNWMIGNEAIEFGIADKLIIKK